MRFDVAFQEESPMEVAFKDAQQVPIPGPPGPQGEPGHTPVRGEDYWTQADKDEIVDEVVARSKEFCLKPRLSITVESGAVVTIYGNGETITRTSAGIVMDFDLPDYGTYTAVATKGGHTSNEAVIEVDTVRRYEATLTVDYVNVYGAQWDGTSSTAWSRTDAAADFVDPVPAVNNGTGSSPFDNLAPWNGMQKVEDDAAGTLVSIPKFWYKWTRSGATMKLQIADKAKEGFSVSPAHQDRGDGFGERDMVYVGRYHCRQSDYRSEPGSQPKAYITRATARSGIHGLGDTYWQFDYATLWTIWMLYLVEFANWNSQKTIGNGCGNGSSRENMGASDGMQYHTGTAQASRDAYGVGCQYRWIEDLWGNVYDWVDGIYFAGADIFVVKNPTDFSDTNGGVNIGTRLTSSGWTSAWSKPGEDGFEWALYPSTYGGNAPAYICDCCYCSASGVVLCCGGYYSQSQAFGLFCLDGYSAASYANGNIGCRLLKLP